MQAIMPSVRVCGSHTVHGSETLASPSGDQSESSEIPIPPLPAPTHDNTNADDLAMVIDHLPSTSATSSKRKFSALSSHPSSALLPTTSSFSAQSSKKKKQGAAETSAPVADQQLGKKVTTAVAMVGMQGTFNQIADVFAQSISVPDDQMAKQTSTAIQNVLTVDDGLTAEEKATVISIFAQKVSIANAYLALTDDKVRRIFLHQIMDDKAA
jgi:hypothetical protein